MQTRSWVEMKLRISSVVVLEESPCPRVSPRTSLQVLVLILVLGPRVLVLVLGSHCPWTTKSFAFCKLSIMYDHVTSIDSVNANVHEDTVKNVLLTDVRLLIDICQQVSHSSL